MAAQTGLSNVLCLVCEYNHIFTQSEMKHYYYDGLTIVLDCMHCDRRHTVIIGKSAVAPTHGEEHAVLPNFYYVQELSLVNPIPVDDCAEPEWII